MNRSWAHPVATAYEIKVSRADFLKDNKWPGYLPLCNQFYFVTPPDLIALSEVPAEAGLMVIANTRLLTKKKAPHRAIQLPEELYRYILMCRVVVARNEYEVERTKDKSIQFWQQFVSKKVELRELGYQVSKAIREKADSIKIENERLKKRIGEYEDISNFLEKIGVDPDGYMPRYALEDRLKQQDEIFPRETVWSIRRLRDALEDALKKLEPKEVKEEAA
jgi:regulator of replication initiation timing